jgi:hypothetical protein
MPERAGRASASAWWTNSGTGKQVIVPYHRGRTLPVGTMRAIIEGSGIEIDNWFA